MWAALAAFQCSARALTYAFVLACKHRGKSAVSATTNATPRRISPSSAESTGIKKPEDLGLFLSLQVVGLLADGFRPCYVKPC